MISGDLWLSLHNNQGACCWDIKKKDKTKRGLGCNVNAEREREKELRGVWERGLYIKIGSQSDLLQ